MTLASLRAAIAPTRRHALPLLALLVPAFWFLFRAVDAGARSPGWAAPRALAALALGYAGATAATALWDARDAEPPSNPALRAVVSPSDGALAVLAVVVAGVVLYFAAALLADVPGWLDAVLTPVGLLLGLPLVAGQLALVALGNAALWFRNPAVRYAGFAAALALTGAWLVVVAAGVSAGLARLRGGRPGTPARE